MLNTLLLVGLILQSDADLKRLKRKQSNRESARRSRMKKQVRICVVGLACLTVQLVHWPHVTGETQLCCHISVPTIVCTHLMSGCLTWRCLRVVPERQAEVDSLARGMMELRSENNVLRGALSTAHGLLERLAREKTALMAQVGGEGSDVEGAREAHAWSSWT